jgi:GTP-binding protein YchF
VATRLVIIGLPNAGKTTVFNALTRAEAKTGGFGAADEPNLATVKVPADVQYYDVAGIAKGIAEKGMSGQLLNHLALGDALLHVVRAFADPDVPHPEERVDPFRDIETMNLELAFADLATVDKRLQRLAAQIPKLRGAERETYEREQVVMTRLKETLEADLPLREVIPDLDPEDQKNLRGFGLLTAKPLLILLNLGEDQLGVEGERLVTGAAERFGRPGFAVEALAGQIEMEIGQLDEADAAAFMADLGIAESSRDRVIRRSFDLLGLMPFFTVGPDECRAWTIRRGTTAVDAAGEIHSDIQRGFIRAEVVSYDDLVAAGSLADARKHGTLRREGKTYTVQDGDVINFLFNI